MDNADYKVLDFLNIKTIAQFKEDVRAYAIDEYNRKIKECCRIVGSCDFEDLDRIANELKEQE